MNNLISYPLCDQNIVGTYIKARVDLPVMIVTPAGSFQQIDILRAGNIYPFIVNRVMTIGDRVTAVFITNKDQYGNVKPWANTYITLKLENVTSSNKPYEYTAPTSVADLFQKVKDNAGKIALGLAGLWLVGKYFSGGRS